MKKCFTAQKVKRVSPRPAAAVRTSGCRTTLPVDMIEYLHSISQTMTKIQFLKDQLEYRAAKVAKLGCSDPCKHVAPSS